MDEKSLDRLGKQYAEEADTLENIITACRQRKRFAMQGGNSEEAQRQERLIDLHTQQRNDLLRLSVWLRHYYDRMEHEQENEQNGGEAPRGLFQVQKGERNEKHHSCIA